MFQNEDIKKAQKVNVNLSVRHTNSFHTAAVQFILPLTGCSPWTSNIIQLHLFWYHRLGKSPQEPNLLHLLLSPEHWDYLE